LPAITGLNCRISSAGTGAGQVRRPEPAAQPANPGVVGDASAQSGHDCRPAATQSGHAAVRRPPGCGPATLQYRPQQRLLPPAWLPLWPSDACTAGSRIRRFPAARRPCRRGDRIKRGQCLPGSVLAAQSNLGASPSQRINLLLLNTAQQEGRTTREGGFIAKDTLVGLWTTESIRTRSSSNQLRTVCSHYWARSSSLIWPRFGGAFFRGPHLEGSGCPELTVVDELTKPVSMGNAQLFDLAAAHELYVALFGPVEALIKNKPLLLIVPTGRLRRLSMRSSKVEGK
jgi:hypothetical protein